MVLQVKMPFSEVRLNHTPLQKIPPKAPLHLHVFTASEEQSVLLTRKTKERVSLASVFRTPALIQGWRGVVIVPLLTPCFALTVSSREKV